MNLKILLSSAMAASALTAGIAMAQEAPTTPAAADATAAPAMQSADPAQGAPDAGVAPTSPDAAAPPSTDTSAAAATSSAAPASATTTNLTLTNGPVADTPENRAKYAPLSHAGKRTAAKGN
jgi:hypothetical protein